MKPRVGSRFVKDGKVCFVESVDFERGIVITRCGVSETIEGTKFHREFPTSSQQPKYLKPRAHTRRGA